MSQDFMDAELFGDFIVEAREHLETIEPNLLELEKAPDNLALLNEIFRPMHSMKGASGFLGLNKMNGLAHRAENILDELRKGTMSITPDIMDIILATTDALRQMIDSLEADMTEGDVDTAPLIQSIDALMAGETAPPAQAAPAQETESAASVEEEAEPVEEEAASGQETAAPVEVEAAPAQESAAPAAQEGAEAGPPLEADAPVASGAPDSSAEPPRQAGDVQAWIASRAPKPSYPLTAFGEAHLRDFGEEARDNISSLSDGLLELEKHPDGQKDLVNDLFRYFHNLKGNSGIIGYQELNGLTHEAETLLNSLRKEENKVSQAIIDLLLLAVDVLEALVFRIDSSTGSVNPFDIDELLEKLREAVAGGHPSLPESLLATAVPSGTVAASEASQAAGADAAMPEASQLAEADTAAAETAADTTSPPASKTAGSASEAAKATGSSSTALDLDDVAMYRNTVKQQFDHIATAIEGMRTDGTNREFADAMFRSLTTIQNSSSFMGLAEIKEYARRTAGIVDQARNSDMDFSIMADLLDQECAIIRDMIEPAINALAASLEAALSAPQSPAEPVAAALSTDKAPEAEAPPVTPQEPVATDGQGASAPAAPKAPATKTEKAKEEAPAPKAAPAVAAESAAKASPAAAPASTSAAKTAAPASKAAAPAAAPPSAPAAKAAAPAAKSGSGAGSEHKVSSTIRVDHEKLDHLMNLIGELIINRNRYTMLARQLEDTSSGVDVSVIAQNLTETTYSMARISDDLQDTIMKVRMVPVASVFSRFPRLVRDLSRKSGKEVDLITEGEDTELDKSVVEVIGDPLVHLIRNSVDHGIEPDEIRKERGKAAKGSVWLRAFYKGNSVAIEIEDDGKGIDPEKMREVAVRKGIISAEEAKALDDREAMELIFAPGFSSAEVITDISGRGVGMDVVRTNIKNLKGSISISSEVGKGTKFTLSLPLTLAIIDALMVTVDNETYAIPLDAVSETTKIESARLTDVKGRKAVTLRGEVLGIVSLAEFLGLSCHMAEQEILNVVVIHDNERRLGLVVDRLLERQEVVIKPLGSYLGDIKGISGATIMGDGSVILILDPHELYMLATSKAG